MASTTSLFFKSSNNQQQKTTQPNQRPNNTTSSKPESNPKPRPRRGGKAQKGPTKTPQRGMGVERLEIERERLYGSSDTTPKQLASKMSSNNHNNHYQQNYVTPLTGVPVHPYPVTLPQYYFPGQVGPSSTGAAAVNLEAVELPSMPNIYLKEATHNTMISYKKKRVNGEEQNNEGGVGFGKGKEKQHVDYCDQSLLQVANNNANYHHHGVNFGGFDVINNNNNNNGENYHHFAVNHGAFPGYYDFTATDSEVMAIHKKWSTSNMMEYGFFPVKPDTTANEEENRKDYDNNNKNYYYKTMDYLDLKLGCSDSSYASSPSSSLTTVTTFTAANVSDTSLDLSLKLSTY